MRIGELIGPNNEVVHPKTSADLVYLEDGRTVEEVLTDNIDYGNAVFEGNTFHFSDDLEGDYAKSFIIKGKTLQNIIPEPCVRGELTNGEMFKKVNEGVEDAHVIEAAMMRASAVGDTVINLLQKPVLKNSLSNYTINQKTNANHENVNTVDGPVEGAIISGDTMVNLMAPSFKAWVDNTANNYTVTEEEVIVDWSTGVPYNMWIQPRNDNAPFFGKRIKPNTDYTFIINILENSPTFDGEPYTNAAVAFQIWGVEGYQPLRYSVPGLKTGIFKFKVNFSTENSGATYSDIFGIAIGGGSLTGDPFINGGKFRISKNVMLLEGDYTNIDIPYFEGMQSATLAYSEEEGQTSILTTTNKNLIPTQKRRYTGINDTTFELIGDEYVYQSSSHPSYVSMDIVDSQFSYTSVTCSYPPSKNQIRDDYLIHCSGDYTLSVAVTKNDSNYSSYYSLAVVYDDDEYTWKNSGSVNAGPSITIPLKIKKGIKHIYLNVWYSGSEFRDTRFKFQLESGSNATDKVPHRSNELKCDQQITLRGIGDIKDTFDATTGRLTRRIGQNVIDGVNLKAIRYYPKEGDFAEFHIGFPGLMRGAAVINNFSNSYIKAQRPSDSESFWANDGDGAIGIVIAKNRLNDISIDGMNEYLKTNPIDFCYELKNKMVEMVQISNLNEEGNLAEVFSAFEDGHIQVLNAKGALLPNVHYEVPTDNSYYVPLKTSTLYTAKNITCPFTIDGVSYSDGDNRTFTTPSAIGEWFMVIEGTIDRPMLIEGDVTGRELEYINGVKSVVNPLIRVVNKNIIPQNYIQGHWNQWSNRLEESSGSITSEDYVDVSWIDGDVTVSFEEGYKVFYCLYDKDKNRIYIDDSLGNGSTISRVLNFKTMAGSKGEIHYIRLNIKRVDGTDLTPKDIENVKIQFEFGRIKTEYVAHKSNITRVIGDIALRSVNGMADQLDLVSKKMTRRIGVVVLDGINCKVTASVDLGGFAIKVNGCKGGYGNDSLSCETFPCGSWNTGRPLTNTYYLYARDIGNELVLKLPTAIATTVNDANEYLKKNPITVYYQLSEFVTEDVEIQTTNQDGEFVDTIYSIPDAYVCISCDEPITPDFHYEVKSDNSFYLEQIEPQNKYTIRGISGPFTVDGYSFHAEEESVLTIPSSLTNRHMITSNPPQSPMMLKGDMRGKDIPYFKGIRSSFDEDDEIEIKTIGKNLFNKNAYKDLKKLFPIASNPRKEMIDGIEVVRVNGNYLNRINLLDQYTSKQYVISGLGALTSELNSCLQFLVYFKDGTSIASARRLVSTVDKLSYYKFVIDVKKEIDYIVLDTSGAHACYIDLNSLQVEEGIDVSPYEEYKECITKINTSSLRSLPNGVCDELIIDRANHKATIIRRTGEIIFDGSADELWSSYNEVAAKAVEGYCISVSNVGDNTNLYCDTLRPNGSAIHARSSQGIGMSSASANIRMCVNRSWLEGFGYSFSDRVGALRNWLSFYPTKVVYPLNHSKIEEVDLNSYPYFYKDGSLILNTKINPTVGIEYTLNQGQKIISQSETLQRHDKQLSRIDQLLADLVYSDYYFAVQRFYDFSINGR